MRLFEVVKTKNPKIDLDWLDQDFDELEKGTSNVPQQKQQTPTPSLKQATANQTRQRVANVSLPPEAGEKLSFLQSLDISDEISDDEALKRAGYSAAAYTTGVEPAETPGTEIAKIENMPAVINSEIVKGSSVEPEWHQVKHLPGYLSSPIRAMGRQVFGTFTSTPIEDIQVIANLGGQGPNSKYELNAVAGWLKNNAERDTDGEMEFEKSIPGYQADFKLYKTHGFSFLLVKDFAGNYIYSWPTADEKTTDSSVGRLPLS